MKKNAPIRIAFIALSVLVGALSGHAQKTPEELSKLIIEKDSIFWASYNRCDTAVNAQFFSEDVEFYHDKGGITYGRHSLVMALQNNLCSNPNWRIRREAIPGTVKVYPLQNNGVIYGAVMSGEHYFYITQNGKPEAREGHASFTHLWLLKDGAWKMHRIISYDHHAAAKDDQRKAITLPASTLSQYAGKYTGPQTKDLLVQQENDALVLIARNGKTPLFAETATLFFMKERDLTFEFIKDTNKVTGLRVRENGAVVEELTRTK